MFVSEICAEGIFVTFPWWLKNVKSRSKIALFSNKRHFEIWFPKKRTNTFFWSKLSKLYKKDPILHVATIFSLKQGETRSSHGPIPHPLSYNKSMALDNLMLLSIPVMWSFSMVTADDQKSKLHVTYQLAHMWINQFIYQGNEWHTRNQRK